MRGHRVGVLAALLTLVAVLLTGCGAKGTGDKGYVTAEGAVTEFAPGDRKPVGDVSGTTLDGKQVSLDQLAGGKPMVVNVWAYWCAPCRAEAKDLNAAAKQLGDKATFLGISIRSSSKANPQAYERTYDITYPSIFDPDGRTLLQFPRGTASPAIPSTVVLDSSGRVSASILGPLPSRRTLVELVDSADSGSAS